MFFLIILCLLGLSYGIYIFVENKKENNLILQKYGSLNDLKFIEVYTVHIEKLKEQLDLVDKYHKELEEEVGEEKIRKTKKVESLLSDFKKIEKAWYYKAKSRYGVYRILEEEGIREGLDKYEEMCERLITERCLKNMNITNSNCIRGLRSIRYIMLGLAEDEKNEDIEDVKNLSMILLLLLEKELNQMMNFVKK